METSPILVEDDPKTINPIVSIDLTQSPCSKPKQMIDDHMEVDTTAFSVKRTVTSTGGTRISTTQMIKQEETEGAEETEEGTDLRCSKAKKPRVLSDKDLGYGDFVKKERVDVSGNETEAEIKTGCRDSLSTRVLLEGCAKYVDSVKEVFDFAEPVIDAEPISVCKSEKMDELEVKQVKPLTGISSNTLRAPLKHEGSVKKERETMDQMDQKPKLVKPISSVKPGSRDSGYGSGLSKKGQGVVEDRKVSLAGIETGDFEEEADWLLVGRTAITGLSTTKGRKLEDNEIVHFAFPNLDVRTKSSYWANSRASSAGCGIVRFSTKRSGEIKFLVAGAIALKALGSFLFIFGSTIGATLLILHQLIATPLLYDFYNYDIEKKEFLQLFIKFTQSLALLGALLFFIGMKNSIPRRSSTTKKAAKTKTV